MRRKRTTPAYLGTRTRHTNARHRPNKVPLLPLAYQTLPRDRARPTPVHPECGTYRTQYGQADHLFRTLTVTDMLMGEGLASPRSRRSVYTYKVVRRGETLGTVTDPAYGLAWCRALRYHGIDDAKLETR